jgi:hypothetical protein
MEVWKAASHLVLQKWSDTTPESLSQTYFWRSASANNKLSEHKTVKMMLKSATAADYKNG